MSKQLVLHSVVVAREVNGIDMGVLEDGTPYLTGRGLARLCGVVPSAIIKQADNWAAGIRDGKFARILVDQGFDEDNLFVPITINNTTTHAYTDSVCMAFLEYYAFEVPTPSVEARGNYRLLARSTLRQFIYNALGYDPAKLVPEPWRQFHDRVLMHSVPVGYFSVFKESADFVIAAIRGGLRIDHKTVPDISIGQAWASYWEESDFESQHGTRIRHAHNYPDYFPQAASNPQPIWVYPVGALGEFRIWMHRIYVVEKLPAYLGGKVRSGAMPASSAEILLTEMQPPMLTDGEDE
jgi:hypothetical protein